MRLVRALPGALSLLGVGLLVVLSVGLTGAPASAHASLVSTDPADGSVVAALPEQVVLTFNEPVRLDGPDAVQGFAADGSDWAVESQARDSSVVVTPVDDPGTGTVVLSWQVISEDGHGVSGALTFTIGDATVATDGPVASPEAPATTETATWLARGVLGAGLAVLAVLAVLGAGGSARATLWYAAFAAAVLLGPLERLRAEGRGLDGLADWLAWLDGLTAARALLLVGATVLAGFLVASRRPVVAGLLGGAAVLTLAVALVVEPADPAQPEAPVAEASEPAAATEQTADLGEAGTVAVTLIPEEGRRHRLDVRLTDPDGAPLRPYAPPTVGLASTDIDLGEPALRRTGPGEYRAIVTVPRDGEWTVRVSVRIDEFTNPVADVPVVVG